MIRFGFFRRPVDEREAEEARYARRLTVHANALPLNDNKTARSLIRWVIGLVAATVIWAAVTPVSETVTGTGRILPVGGARPAQTLDGGLVAEVRVTEGSFVIAGQTLVRFDRTEESLDLRRLKARWQGRIAERARMRAVANGTSFAAPDTEAGQEQVRAFQADLALDQAIKDRLIAAADAAERQIAFSETRIAALQEELVLAHGMEDRMQQLLGRGAVSARTAEDALRTRLRIAQDLAEAESEEAMARVAAADAALALTRHTADRRARAAERVTVLSTEIAELDGEIARMREHIARDRVVAPVAGRIQDLVVRDAGQAVPAEGTVATIVPEHGELFAELRVSADRIANVSSGLTASVKVLAFDFARFGAIAGEVVSVSPSSDVDEMGNVSFRVRLRLWKDPDNPIDVRPGLSVTADLKTGSKTVLEYFIKPVRVLRDRALTEA